MRTVIGNDLKASNLFGWNTGEGDELLAGLLVEGGHGDPPLVPGGAPVQEYRRHRTLLIQKEEFSSVTT